ncbi:LOW QUALITY PROTEIN: Y+L amino acid transporter 2-like [Homarus americanus]|uniref:LOW QUALITY PROTEIN: Y+L amino acid transporter 2-like n=1 Tax=Homarus americanus TaxID=6706 RepID=UPI001C4945F0|nr:LOW QUALITY PROTEIN: Y+L amino acid transporter 2-like [Homarus americanus]
MKVHPMTPSVGTSPRTTHGEPHTATEGDDNINTDNCVDVVELKRELGLLDCISVIIGIVSGSGIFISPRGVLEYSGSVGLSLLVWGLSGLVSLIGALTFTELATMMPESGGMYTYIHTAFGPLPAFVYLWTALIIEEPTMRVIDAFTFGTYVLQPFFPSDPPQVPVRLLAAALILFLAWVNCRGLKGSVNLQDVLMIPKVLILGSIIGVGFYQLATGTSSSTSYQGDVFQGTRLSVAVIATAFYQGLYTYDGWDNLNMVVEEMKDPDRTFPLATGVSLSFLTVVYVLTNVAYFAVLSPQDVMSSTAVAVTFGQAAFGVMAWAVPVSVAISTLASLLRDLRLIRMVFAGARRGHLPKTLSLINIKNCTPVPFIIFMTILTLLLLFSPDVYSLINLLAFSHSFSRLFGTIGLLWLRYKRPEWKRPFKVWLVLPVFYLVLSVMLVVFPVVEEPVTVGIALGVIALGVLVYFLFIYRKIESRTYNSLSDRIYRFVQILLEVMPEKKA